MALDQRSLRLFEACSCKPASEGLPPSLEQHRARFLTILRVPGTHSPTVSLLPKAYFLFQDAFPQGHVSLTPELNQFIAEKVKGGFYSSAIEVIREGLRLLKQYDEIQRVKLQQLRADIEKGIASLDGGKGKPLDIEAIKAEGRKRRKAAKKARK